MGTTVVRTTTEKLESAIAMQETADRTLISSQFVGGRDWVLFFAQMITLESVADSLITYEPYRHDSIVTEGEDGAIYPITHRYAGVVEDRARTWIMYVDEVGRPAALWLLRDNGGGVIGHGLSFDRSGAMSVIQSGPSD